VFFEIIKTQPIMKKIKFLFIAICLSTSYVHAQTSVASNTITSGNYLGSSNNLDVIFKRYNIQAGLINTSNTSFGLSSLNTSSTGIQNSVFGAYSLVNNTTGSIILQ
jgi:hypothetical protein